MEKVDKAQTKKDNFIISWWNGGGKLVARPGVNPGLRKFLETTPDIFAYGEALVFRRTREINLQKYNCILHKSEKGTLRRGLALYHRNKINNITTKIHKSQ